MTPLERDGLREARRLIRHALHKFDIGRTKEALEFVQAAFSTCSYQGRVTYEVKNMLASLTVTKSDDLIKNVAMRAAAIRRLKETKTLISESLVATTDH